MLKSSYLKNLILKLCSISFGLLFSLQLFAQDFHFTQFYANKLYLSPSFAGATAQNRFIASYRNQWPAVNGFVTYAASFDHYFTNFNSGLGFLMMRDVAGDGNLGITNLGIYYSYDFSLNQSVHVRPGVSLSYRQHSIDESKLHYSSQVTADGISPPTTSYSRERIGAPDAGVSSIIYSKNWWLGATFDHLMRPNMSLMGEVDKLPLKMSFFGGATIIRRGRLLNPVDETVSLAFNCQKMATSLQTDIGLYWAKIPLTFGLWYRGIPYLNSDRGDMLAVLVGFRTNHFGISYSYDFTISNLVNMTSGAHEISLSYEFYKKLKRKIRAIPCPEL
jgi:type IX secretion system PorP/SprF family membrane protein